MAKRIEVELVGDSSSLERAFGRAGSSGSKLGNTIGKGLKLAALGAGAALGGLAVVAKIGFDEFNQGQKVAAQTAAVIKSTGKAANVTAKQVENLSGALMKKSGVDDEVIASGQNMLLTFKNIRNETGKGNDIFRQATEATLDLSVAMGKDMASSAILVGKALNDPIKGMGALRRVGIQFTAAQEKVIKKLVESGDVMGAQKIILKELESQFGGSAAAAGKTFSGQINILRESFNNWAGDMVGKVMPTLQKFLRKITKADGLKAKIEVILAIGKFQLRRLAKMIEEGMRGVDWSAVGKVIGEGISTRVRITADFLTKALTTMNEFIDQHINEFAEVGAKLMLAVMDKLLDPVFWARNWELALGVAAAFIPVGGAARVGGRLALLILRPFSKFLGPGLARITVRAIDGMLSIFARLPDLLGQIALRAALATLPGLRLIPGFFLGPLRTVLERVPGWLKAAFRLTFWLSFVNALQAGWSRAKKATQDAVDFMARQWGRVSGPLSTIVGWLSTIYNWLIKITRTPWRVVISIPRPSLPDIPGIPGIASGGDIARSGLAVVHRGERVLPAHVVNRGGGNGGSGFPGGPVAVMTSREIAVWLQGVAADYGRQNGGRGLLA